MDYPKKYNALRVQQPFGEFFVISIKAHDLLEISFSDVLRYKEDGTLRGSQRELDEKKRVKEISAYINSQDLAFPNSIIIAANYNEDGFIEEKEKLTWKLINKSDNIYEIIVPTNYKLASIIDGQHRLNGFKEATSDRKKNTDLLVAIYFDLPSPYQAYLFASINYNQKPVSKSLALEQFGYLTEITPADSWSPELLSVYLSRQLNLDKDSNFFNHIKVAPQNDEFLLTIDPKDQSWLISSATVVDGILKLITTNPKRDSNILNNLEIKDRKRELLINVFDKTPLRSFYLSNNDIFIYKAVINFFNAVEFMIFKHVPDTSYIKKTVGIQALFGILKEILANKLEIDKNISIDYFSQFVNKFSKVDFSDNFYTASGLGKSRIQNSILIVLGYKTFSDIKNEIDRENYKRILKEV